VEAKDMSDTIRMSNNLNDLTGSGTEYLLSKDGTEIIAKFIGGNLAGAAPVGNNENTVSIPDSASEQKE
jgi:hypothetical protein